jgi:hypothetical protein
MWEWLMMRLSGSSRFRESPPLPRKNPSINEDLSHFCLTPHQTYIKQVLTFCAACEKLVPNSASPASLNNLGSSANI